MDIECVTPELLKQLVGPLKNHERWLVLDGARPDAVAAELGLTVNAVFIAKSRVLQRLRQEARDLLD